MRIGTAVLATLLALAPFAANAHEGSVAAARLGKVHFDVSCNAEAQKEFDLAMSYYHSFAWELYKAPLERALKSDPSCGMAHWARALGMLDNPFGWPVNLSAKTFADGQSALDAARAAGLKTQREKDYVEALQVFYTDHDKLNHRTRSQAFEKAMERVAQSHPNDIEAAILHALFLSATFDPADKQYTNQLRAARILEPIFVAQPEHPGVAHYIIHSYDYPPLARQGLDAAKRYSKIAPDAAHALHMPSHIFTRVGAWKESVESNRAAAEAARASIQNRVHAMDYMVYAHIQLGQDAAARKVYEESLKLTSPADNFAVAFGLAAIPARLALERLDWKRAADLPLNPAQGTYVWNKYPHAEAANAYARGIGAASLGDVAAARGQVERLKKLRDAAGELKFAYWVEQIDIQAAVVGALALCAEGKKAECVEALRKAADREDATEKHVVTPGSLVPAREVLARALFEQGKAADALREYEAVMTKEPNRYRTLADAAQTAEKMGDRAKASKYYAQLAQMTREADSEPPELVKARAYAAK
jgi:Tfp pilus assembly protein PilF